MHAQTKTDNITSRGSESRDHRIAALLSELADQMTTLSLFNDQTEWDALRDRARAAAEELAGA